MKPHHSYDPKHPRSCRHCYKKILTEDGVLESKYKFSCSPCHDRWKNIYRGATAGGIFFGLILAIIFLRWYLKKDNDPNE